MPSNCEILVVGSVHMDLIATAVRFPLRGESVSGGLFSMGAGGKAGNQASLISSLGFRTCVIARLGDDLFGKQLLHSLQQRGVETRFVAIDPEHATGASTILAAEGDYSSIISPGAASFLNQGDVQLAFGAIQPPLALLVQLELPIPITLFAAKVAKSAGTPVILNASPVPDAIGNEIGDLLRLTSILFVNRVEANRLLGSSVGIVDAGELASQLSAGFGIETVIVTAGSEESAGISPELGIVRVGAFPASVVDTVGAGDALLSATTAGLVSGLSLSSAMRRGAAAGAMLVSREGASGKLPTSSDIDDFLAKNEI